MTFFLWISNSELVNFADDKIICAAENTSEEHISTLEKKVKQSLTSLYETNNCVKLLGVEIDNKLSFEKHISTLCKKASNQWNAISKIQKFMGFKEKELFKIALSIQTLITVLLCVSFLLNKIGKKDT